MTVQLLSTRKYLGGDGVEVGRQEENEGSRKPLFNTELEFVETSVPLF